MGLKSSIFMLLLITILRSHGQELSDITSSDQKSFFKREVLRDNYPLEQIITSERNPFRYHPLAKTQDEQEVFNYSMDIVEPDGIPGILIKKPDSLLHYRMPTIGLPHHQSVDK